MIYWLTFKLYFIGFYLWTGFYLFKPDDAKTTLQFLLILFRNEKRSSSGAYYGGGGGGLIGAPPPAGFLKF